jgi:amino acid transporter
MPTNLRRLIFGSPFETARAQHTRLPNVLALPVFASDALSSVSYATEEILLVLVLASVTAPMVLQYSWPIGLAIAALLAIVATSYRQTIHAYPQGGGAYRVSRENLGMIPGLVAGSSLLIDYVLTVAVSISAGVAAITSAFPSLAPHSVPIAVACIVLVGLANLRGAKESGLLFAVPTYLFIAAMSTLLVVGFYRVLAGHALSPPQPAPDTWANASASVTAFLLLRAFSSGCTALTGVEAVTDGVPAFKPPEARNAAKVLAWLAIILITLFLGITFLAHKIGVIPFPAEVEAGHHRHTVISQIAWAVFGQGAFYYVVQAATAMILILAANTAFVDFPRLSMFLAQDRFLPRQFANVGDRLVFSNGIIGLTVLSILTVVAFQASTHHLIPLYALGVFLSFTLSQSGMVVRWLRLKPAGWQWGALISGVGAVATCVVLLIIAVTKFVAGEPLEAFPLTTPVGLWAGFTGITFVLLSMYHRWLGKGFLGLSVLGFLAAWGLLGLQPLSYVEVHLGAWLVMAAIPAIVWMCFRINAHYREVAEHLTMDRYETVPEFRHTVLVLVPGVHRGVMPAVQYGRSIGGDVRAVYVEIDPEKTAETLRRWRQYVPDLPLVVLESPYRSLASPLMAYIGEVERERDDDIVTVIIPEFVTEKWWTKLMHGQTGLILKWSLLFHKGVVVTNIRYYLDGHVPGARDHPLTAALDHSEEAAAPDGAEPPPAAV